MWKRGKIAPEEQFLPFSTIFYYLMLDFYVKTGIRFSLRDKRLFEITEVEITRVDCTVEWEYSQEKQLFLFHVNFPPQRLSTLKTNNWLFYEHSLFFKVDPILENYIYVVLGHKHQGTKVLRLENLARKNIVVCPFTIYSQTCLCGHLY